MQASDVPRTFEFLREIASGGFGGVYEARVFHGDGTSGIVAVKLLHKRWSRHAEITSRMRDEAQLLGWVRHPNIVDVVDQTSIDGRCAVVMEYLDGMDLRVLVDALRDGDGVLPLGVALELGGAVCTALDAAYNCTPEGHEQPLNLIHRDIKPSNVMVDAHGVVKVLDFGGARAEFDTREAKTSELAFGSLEYMPPERLFFEPDSPASDVYSLGSTLYEVLALEPLGKAKLRPVEHQRFLVSRIDDLIASRGTPDRPHAAALQKLLAAMLSFDEFHRPTAAACFERMQTVAGRCGGPALADWAQQRVPVLMRQVPPRAAPVTGLVGSVLTEDPSARAAVWTPEPAPRQGPGLPEPDSGAFPVGRDEAAWSEMREAALQALSQTDEVLPGADTPVADWLARERTDPQEALSTVRMPTGSEPEETPAPGVLAEAPLEPAFTPLPRAPRRWLVPAVAATGAAGLLGALSLALVGGTGALLMSQSLPGPQPAPSEPVGRAEPEVPVADGARFVSALPKTRRLSVRCEGVQGSGDAEVVLPDRPLGRCAVTAVDQDRKRRTTVISDAENRRYVCFADGGADCE